jgi:hypothetical protein
MVLLYDPGDRMPGVLGDFPAMSWLISWPDGPWHLHDVEVGGTVLLVDSGPAQRIVWETRVTHSFAVPYETVNDLAVEIFRRWGLVVETPEMVPGGFSIGWRSECVARLDRDPLEMPAGTPTDEADELDLRGFQQSAHMSAAFNKRWGIVDEPEVFCSGRPALGWFGPSSQAFGSK